MVAGVRLFLAPANRGYPGLKGRKTVVDVVENIDSWQPLCTAAEDNNGEIAKLTTK